MSKPTWANVSVRLGDLKPWAENPKFSTKAQAQRLLKSFERFGQVSTVAIGPGLEVYDGHQRLSALLTIHGADYEIAARQSDRPLTDDERRELVVTLHAGAVGSWDWNALAGWEAGQLQDWGLDAETLKGWNADATNLKEMLRADAPPDVDAEPQVDRAEELREKWQTERGQLWRIGAHRLLCGDSSDNNLVALITNGLIADCTITDPPYGIGRDGGRHSTSEHGGRKAFAFHGWDNSRPSKEVFDSIRRVSKRQIIWGGNYFADLLPPTQKWLVWDKGQRISQSDGELAWTSDNGALRIFTINRVELLRDGTNHPTQKPLALIEKCVEQFSAMGETIYDPFAGSGTTVAACEKLGRKCMAIEIDPAYCAVILERMATAFPGIDIERIETESLINGQQQPD